MHDTPPEFEFLSLATIQMEPGFHELGRRAVATITGGTLVGPRLNGRFLPSGGDWMTHDDDGLISLDVRASVETDDGAVIGCSYKGRLKMPDHVRAMPITDRHRVDPAEYYLRVAPLFETAHPDYAWLNAVQTVAKGRIVPDGVAYHIYTML